MRTLALITAAVVVTAFAPVRAAEEAAAAGAEASHASDWKHWQAGNEIHNVASLQRGARNFMNYCSGCHSLKYMRYSRMADDLNITEEQLKKNLILRADAKPTDYMLSAMPAVDAETWFGKAPPDLSLTARSRGTDWIYQFLKTFYADSAKPTGVNNLRFPDTAMPHVLGELQGVHDAVFVSREVAGEGGKATTVREFARFENGAPGAMSEADYDAFVRDTVNFLDYVGEPTQADRQQLGVWVVLFLLLFTWIAWLLKKEYWKDVH